MIRYTQRLDPGNRQGRNFIDSWTERKHFQHVHVAPRPQPGAVSLCAWHQREYIRKATNNTTLNFFLLNEFSTLCLQFWCTEGLKAKLECQQDLKTRNNFTKGKHKRESQSQQTAESSASKPRDEINKCATNWSNHLNQFYANVEINYVAATTEATVVCITVRPRW